MLSCPHKAMSKEKIKASALESVGTSALFTDYISGLI